MKNKNYKILLFFILILLSSFSNNIFAETKELELYNEWYSDKCSYKPDRPFFIIRDNITLNNFWPKSGFDGFMPLIDFKKFMLFVWIPGAVRKDFSKLNFEKFLYKDNSILVLLENVEEYNKSYRHTSYKPIKAIICPYVDPCDIFVFKKVKKGWQSYEYIPIHTAWNMSGTRKRPFESVDVDKIEDKKIVLATYADLDLPKTTIDKNEPSEEELDVETSNEQTKPKTTVRPITIVSTPKVNNPPKQSYTYSPPKSSSTPISSTPSQSTQNSNPVKNQSNSKDNVYDDFDLGFGSSQPKSKPDTNKPQVTNAPINVGGTSSGQKSSTSTPSPEPKTQSAPGMEEDPLFGSEFDITF